MKLSKTAHNAVLALVFLSQTADRQPVQARQVASHLDIPTDSALKVLQSLARAGVLSSQLGRHGGYRLARPAALTSVLDVVEAIDGPLDRAAQDLPPAPNHLADVRESLAHACGEAARTVRHAFGQLTIAHLNNAPPLAAAA